MANNRGSLSVTATRVAAPGNAALVTAEPLHWEACTWAEGKGERGECGKWQSRQSVSGQSVSGQCVLGQEAIAAIYTEYRLSNGKNGKTTSNV